MRSIIVLGGNKLHRGFEELKKKINIDEVIVIDWNENPDYSGDRHVQLDIKDYDRISQLDIKWDHVAFVYTSADIAVNVQKQLHKKLGLCVPSDLAVENALVKGKMRDCWESEHILNKYSAVIKSANEFTDIGASKYIFKPNCSSGSRNITILHKSGLTVDNIVHAVEHAKNASIDGRCIAEEFVEGTEYTVDMLGDSYGNVAVYGISKKYHTPYNSENKIATKLHYAPNDIHAELLDEIAEFGIKCYQGIGLHSSLGHLEVIVKTDGTIVPVEIGARSSGYIATTLVDLINNTCYLGEYERVIHGGKVVNGRVFDGSKSSMYYFYDITPGWSVCKTNIMEFLPKGITSYASDRHNLYANQRFSMINADHERYGFEILGGSSDVLTIENVINAENAFNYRFIVTEG